MKKRTSRVKQESIERRGDNRKLGHPFTSVVGTAFQWPRHPIRSASSTRVVAYAVRTVPKPRKRSKLLKRT